MRARLLLAVALLALALLPGTARGQTERVLIDATIDTLPTMGSGLCVVLPEGTLTVSAGLLDADAITGLQPATLQPVTFELYGHRGSDQGASTEVLLSRALKSFTSDIALVGGLYCWSLQNRAPVSANAGMAELTNARQYVALRLALTPRQ